MIGIDVGGANLKIADDRGIHVHYCPLWEGAPIAALLAPYASRDPEAAVVMSGELADCFENKNLGIRFIVDTVREAFPAARFYGTDGLFHDHAVPALAAANWLASADLIRERFSEAVLLDIGSTTADIIPLSDFASLKGQTDLLRLQNGCLIYTGMLRTPVAAMVEEVMVGGVRTPVCPEFFAVSADVHLALGHIAPDMYTCDAPDRKEKTVDASLRRLARVVCADLDEIGRDAALSIANQAWDSQRRRVCSGVVRICQEKSLKTVVVAGIGARLFAGELGGIVLNDVLGDVADALPAWAVRSIAMRQRIS